MGVARLSVFFEASSASTVMAHYRAYFWCGEALRLKSTSGLDTVSTGSGSDLVGDLHAIFLVILDSDR
jgi:hypothetical protein